MQNKAQSKDLTLIQLFDKFDTESKAIKHLEAVLWKDGIVCPHCQCKDQSKFGAIKANANAKTREGLYWCASCQSKFRVTIGTIFEDSHIPLRKWLIAWYLLCSSKKGISSLQLKRILEIGSYQTALFMTHRIRHALKDDAFADKLGGAVEADDCYVPVGKNPPGAKRLTKHVRVFSMLERGGRVRSKVLNTVSGSNLRDIIRANVIPKSELYTDQHFSYRYLDQEYDHHDVKHGEGEFKRREGQRLVSTGSVEGFFSLLKRGVIGTFHHVSEQYLDLYIAEFDHRHNCRKMTDGERTDLGLAKAAGKRLMYRR
jgi:transposase-like protein